MPKITQDKMYNRLFKIITSTSGEITAPTGTVFQAIAPIGFSATAKALSSRSADGSDSLASNGNYSTGSALELVGVDIGPYRKITVTAGTLKAWYW